MTTSNMHGPQQDTGLIKHLAKEGSTLVGQFRLAVKEVLDQLAQELSQQRVRMAEHRAESAQAVEHLKNIHTEARNTQLAHEKAARSVKAQLSDLVEAAKTASQAQLETYGKAIVAGIQLEIDGTLKSAEEAASQLQSASGALRWKTVGIFLSSVIGLALFSGIFLWGWTEILRTEIATLQSERARLTTNLETLTRQGAKLDFRQCPGDIRHRHCVRVNPRTTRFGLEREYAVVDDE